MPEGHQYPFKEFLQPRTFLPVDVIEGLRIFQALVKMVYKLAAKAFVLTKQANLMLVPETTVIEISRTYHEKFSVGKKNFGVQILR